ncbi:unnamed protein product [Nyctereutes procyonoides]|uniref:(raccoon dog) hypothetical protein n=1 Tax=Nyctereutes procyonoides TaxID=34880 RepID=A0A811Y284_NYCPR|nr:unnamed protein product [Nyctereutes procyonoides]
MKIFVFAFVMALMIAMIGADSSEERLLKRIGDVPVTHSPPPPRPPPPPPPLVHFPELEVFMFCLPF